MWSGQQNKKCEQQSIDRLREEEPGSRKSEKDMHWANTCGLSNPSPLPVAFTTYTHSLTDSLDKLSVLLSPNFIYAYFAA